MKPGVLILTLQTTAEACRETEPPGECVGLLDALETTTYEVSELAARIRAAKINNTPVKHPVKPIKPKPKPPPKPKDAGEYESTHTLAERVTTLEEDLAKLRKEVAAYYEAEQIMRRAAAWATPSKNGGRSATVKPRFRAVKNTQCDATVADLRQSTRGQ